MKAHGIAITDQQVRTIDTAIHTSVGVLVTKLASGAKPLAQITVTDPEVRAQAQRIIDAVPDAVAGLKPSAETLATKIVAGVGNAIAADPTVPTVPITTEAAASGPAGTSTSTASTAATDNPNP